MMKSSSLAVATVACAMVVQAEFVGETLTISEPTSTKTTYPGVYNTVVVDADFTLDGAELTNGLAGASAVIGENAAAPVVVTVTNAQKRAWETYSFATLTFKGKGGRLDLHGKTLPDVGWGPATADEKTLFGNDYMNNGGTMGRHLVINLQVDASAVPADGIVDIATLRENALLGMSTLNNKTAGSVARILFDGGRTYAGHASFKTWFCPDPNTEIRLEGVNGNPIFLCHNYANNAVFSTADGTANTGKLSTRGDADVIFGPGNSTIPTVQLKGKVDWGHAGDLYLAGACYYKLMHDDFLPSGEGRGDVYVQRYCSKYKTGHNGNLYVCWLDMNGTTQHVNSICSADGTQYPNLCFVTNTASRRAVLYVDRSVKGIFAGPLDVYLGGTVGQAVDFSGSQFINGAKLHVAAGSSRVGEGEAPNPDGVEFGPGVELSVSNSLFESFSTLGGKTTVEGWRWNTYDWDKPAGTDPGCRAGTSVPTKQADAVKRDWAPSFMWTCDVAAGSELDVTRGVLVSSNLTAGAGAKIVVSSNAAVRIQSRQTRVAKSRYIRFTFKQTMASDYLSLRRLTLACADGSVYALADNGYVRNETATAASDLAEGEYMFNAPFYTGKGEDLLSDVFASAYRNKSYTYDGSTFLRNNTSWTGVLFTDSKPVSSDSATWKVVTARLTADVPDLAGYRFANDWNLSALLVSWSVEMSTDGISWTTVDDRPEYYCFAHSSPQSGKFPYAEGYDAYNSNPISAPLCKAEGEIFRWTSNVDPTTVRADFGGAAVRVDCGGTLDLAQTDGTTEIAALEADPAKGLGTFRHVTFAANGTLNLVADAAALRGHVYLPVAFENCSGVASLDVWTVTLNGTPVDNCTLTYDAANGRLDVHARSGLLLLLR